MSGRGVELECHRALVDGIDVVGIDEAMPSGALLLVNHDPSKPPPARLAHMQDEHLFASIQ